MRKGMLVFLLSVTTLGLGGWLSGGSGEDPRVKVPAESENKALARLEQRILQLEKRLAALEQENGIRDDDEGWKSRALGSNVVNGSRVYVLPLSHSTSRN